MVKVRIKQWDIELGEMTDRFAYGMITQLRNRSQLAYVQFLPIEEVSDQWVVFNAMKKRDSPESL